MSEVTAIEKITIPASWNLEFEHAAGKAASRFLIALRDEGQLWASPCPNCERKRVPARSYCEDCFVPTSDEWIKVGPQGTLRTFSITYAEFPGYRTPPHVVAYVVPDGADTAIANYVQGIDLTDPDAVVAQLKPGTRMRAVFEEDRQALVTDFHWEVD